MKAIQYQAARKKENFPVASWLLPQAARPAILAFYDFARGADTLADDPALPIEQRREQLQYLLDMLASPQGTDVPFWAQACVDKVRTGVLPVEPAEHLLVAFIRDTAQSRYPSFDELLDYCRYSAVPVGRLVLAACDEREADLEAADALCIVLQLLNHVQDVRADYLRLNRIYLPQDWMQEAGVSEAMLGVVDSSPGLRQVIDRLLDACTSMLVRARPLPASLHSLRSRMEIATIWQVAKRLQRLLYQQDPLAGRVQLSRLQTVGCVWRGIMKGMLP